MVDLICFLIKLWGNCGSMDPVILAQPAIICSNLILETLEQGVKFV